MLKVEGAWCTVLLSEMLETLSRNGGRDGDVGFACTSVIPSLVRSYSLCRSLSTLAFYSSFLESQHHIFNATFCFAVEI